MMNRLVSGLLPVVGLVAGAGCMVGDEPESEPGSSAAVATQIYCPSGFAFDAGHGLCLSPNEGAGPFPRSMIDDCRAVVTDRADGSNSCETTATGAVNTRWARSVAIAARANTLEANGCAAGTTRDARSGYCADGVDIYGPFDKAVVTYCKAHGGGGACETNRIAASLAPSRSQGPGEWAYLLPADFGVRDDSTGGGEFGAGRSNSAGTHSGIDFLAPLGTSLFSVCDSTDVQTGYDAGYGNWVQIVCRAPASLSGGRTVWASMLYAHLSSVSVVSGGSVARGGRIGAVGKTGNASPAGINPHVHFEITLHPSQAAAHADLHGSADNTSNQTSVDFEASLRSGCLSPNGITAKTGPVRRGRRPDPYLVLVCSVRGKPALQTPPANVQGFLERWSTHFGATGFDINVGR